MKFLEVKPPDFRAAGESLVDLIKRRIRSAPGGRWNKTGRLLSSIRAVLNRGHVSVVAAGDRLQSDELAERFSREVMPTSIDEATRQAIARAIFGAFGTDAK